MSYWLPWEAHILLSEIGSFSEKRLNIRKKYLKLPVLFNVKIRKQTQFRIFSYWFWLIFRKQYQFQTADMWNWVGFRILILDRTGNFTYFFLILTLFSENEPISESKILASHGSQYDIYSVSIEAILTNIMATLLSPPQRGFADPFCLCTVLRPQSPTNGFRLLAVAAFPTHTKARQTAFSKHLVATFAPSHHKAQPNRLSPTLARSLCPSLPPQSPPKRL